MTVRTRLPILRRTAFVLAVGALAAPATAGAATAHAASSSKRLPVITKVTPTSVVAGTKLTLRGRNFVRGKAKNTVVFQAKGTRSVFVKADIATTKMLTVVVPKTLPFATRAGVAVPTRFSVRVLAKKLGKAYKTSPLVAPAAAAAAATPAPVAPAVTESCLSRGADADGDLISNDLELRLGTNPCSADSDGDGVSDGYEYQSAIDLNNDDYSNPQSSLPYPGTKPYPNPLDGSDADTDYDGDSLTLKTEYQLWRYDVNALGAANSLSSLTYSDGLQYSIYTRNGQGRRVPALAAAGYDRGVAFRTWADAAGYGTVTLNGSDYDLFDFDRNGSPDTVAYDLDGDGYLSDDERDEDADGLTNYQEFTGPLRDQAWWTGSLSSEGSFPLPYAGTDPWNPDTDGDGIRDGADDQDHDDVPNIVEASRSRITHTSIQLTTDNTPQSGNPWYGRVNPFNPCLPDRNSRTCPRYYSNPSYAPLNDGTTYSATTYFVRN